MNIGIDCGSLSISDDRLKTGVYRLSAELLVNLSKIDRKNRYFLYTFLPLEKEIQNNLGGNFQNKIIKPRFGWSKLSLSREILLRRPDIFLGLNQAVPLYHPAKNLILVYDLAFELFPDAYPKIAGKLSRQTKNAAGSADKIIAISKATKNDLIRLYGIDNRKIEVNYPGISSRYHLQNLSKLQMIKDKYRLNKPYIFFLGSLKPVKNYQRVFEAYKMLTPKIKNRFNLVIAGSDFWLNSKNKFWAGNNDPFIRYLGFVEESDLPSLYGAAELFLSPSLYEGFGFPLAEAMSCGCPVLTSNTGSMPEVVGNAGLKIDPFDVKKISQSIIEILENEKLKKELKKKSLEQAKKFTWEKFAQNVYNNLIAL